MEFPDNVPVVGDDNRSTAPWNHWFQRVQNVVTAAYGSGPTSERPDAYLWIGRRFFDTTLGKPVWVKSVKPTVWVDATGTVMP